MEGSRDSRRLAGAPAPGAGARASDSGARHGRAARKGATTARPGRVTVDRIRFAESVRPGWGEEGLGRALRWRRGGLGREPRAPTRTRTSDRGGRVPSHGQPLAGQILLDGLKRKTCVSESTFRDPQKLGGRTASTESPVAAVVCDVCSWQPPGPARAFPSRRSAVEEAAARKIGRCGCRRPDADAHHQRARRERRISHGSSRPLLGEEGSHAIAPHPTPPPFRLSPEAGGRLLCPLLSASAAAGDSVLVPGGDRREGGGGSLSGLGEGPWLGEEEVRRRRGGGRGRRCRWEYGLRKASNGGGGAGSEKDRRKGEGSRIESVFNFSLNETPREGKDLT
jgi:hypothetical protein